MMTEAIGFLEILPLPADLELTPRDYDMLRCLAAGESSKLIARRFDLSETTVKQHLRRLNPKIGVSCRTQAAVWAVRHGIQPVDGVWPGI